MTHAQRANRILAALGKGRRTGGVKATLALAHAELEVADAIRDQTKALNRQTDRVLAAWKDT